MQNLEFSRITDQTYRMEQRRHRQENTSTRIEFELPTKAMAFKLQHLPESHGRLHSTDSAASPQVLLLCSGVWKFTILKCGPVMLGTVGKGPHFSKLSVWAKKVLDEDICLQAESARERPLFRSLDTMPERCRERQGIKNKGARQTIT